MYYDFNNDGFNEIFIGLLIFISPLDKSGDLRSNALIILILFNLLYKKVITFPRIGNVKFYEEEKSRKLRIIFTIIFAIVFVPLIIVPILIGRFVGETYLHMLMILFILFLFLIPIYYDYSYGDKRSYLYFMLFIVSVFISPYLRPFLGESLCNIFLSIIPGIILVLYGVYLLIKFIKKYPIVKQNG